MINNEANSFSLKPSRLKSRRIKEAKYRSHVAKCSRKVLKPTAKAYKAAS